MVAHFRVSLPFVNAPPSRSGGALLPGKKGGSPEQTNMNPQTKGRLQKGPQKGAPIKRAANGGKLLQERRERRRAALDGRHMNWAILTPGFLASMLGASGHLGLREGLWGVVRGVLGAL